MTTVDIDDLYVRITRLEAEVAALRDDKAIREVLARHDYYLDSQRDEDWLDLWTDDGSYDLASTVVYPDGTSRDFCDTWSGPERLREFIANPHGHHREGFYGHSLHTAGHNVVVEIDDDGATVHSYSVLFQEATGAMQLLSAGSNFWALRRVGSGWKLRERRKRQVGHPRFGDVLF